MTTEARCEIKCEHCGIWIPSPIQFGDKESFFGCDLIGNTLECMSCGEMTGCNKENMCFDCRNSEGLVVHEEGKDAFKSG
jgi:hypothetical protein